MHSFQEVIGVDVSITQIEEAKQALKENSNVKFMVGNAHNLPIEHFKGDIGMANYDTTSGTRGCIPNPYIFV